MIGYVANSWNLIKDPYNFDFLTLGPDLLERDLERSLIQHERDLILELGKGFAFVGSQYHLEIGGQDFFLDLLFYHLRLRCYIVIDLKIEEFKPEFAGKMNFYLSAVDDLLRRSEDQPSLGLISHDPRHPLVVHGHAPAMQLRRNPSIAVTAAMLPKQFVGSQIALPSLPQQVAVPSATGKSPGG